MKAFYQKYKEAVCIASFFILVIAAGGGATGIQTFTGISDTGIVFTNSSAQTKLGTFSVVGIFRVGITTGTDYKVIILGSERVYGKVHADSSTFAGFSFFNSTATGDTAWLRQLFVSTIGYNNFSSTDSRGIRFFDLSYIRVGTMTYPFVSTLTVVGSVDVSSNMKALAFIGDGSLITNLSSTALQPGSTSYIHNRNTLQSGATFYVSSGTVDGAFYIIGTGVSGSSDIFRVGNSTFVIQKTGYVGLGTNNPSSIFEVRGGSLSNTGDNAGFRTEGIVTASSVNAPGGFSSTGTVVGSTVIAETGKFGKAMVSTITGLSPLFIYDTKEIRFWDGGIFLSSDATKNSLPQGAGVVASSNTSVEVRAATTAVQTRLDNSTNAAANTGGDGVVNTSSNPLDWTKLKSVPAGFADGTDDGGTLGAGVVFPTNTTNLVSNNNLRKYWDLVLGSAGAINVDGNFFDQTGFAINMTSVQLNGLTYDNSTESTASAKIFIRNGLYPVNNLIIPAGADVVCGSSVVFKNSGGASATIATIYGSVDGCMFDESGLSFSSVKVIKMKSGSKIKNCKIYGISGQTTNSATLYIGNSTNVLVENVYFKGSRATPGSSYYGDGSVVWTEFSSNVYIRRITLDSVDAGHTDGTNMSVFGSTNVHIEDSVFKNMQANGISINTGNKDIFVERNEWYATGNADNTHGSFIAFPADFTAVYTSATVIRDNNIYLLTGQTENLIYMNTGASKGVHGTIIDGNRVRSQVGSTNWTFISTDARTYNTVITNNHCNQILNFISSGGSGDTYTGNDNFLNYAEQ